MIEDLLFKAADFITVHQNQLSYIGAAALMGIAVYGGIMEDDIKGKETILKFNLDKKGNTMSVEKVKFIRFQFKQHNYG